VLAVLFDPAIRKKLTDFTQPRSPQIYPLLNDIENPSPLLDLVGPPKLTRKLKKTV
jgi:hypothetical protein